MQIYHTFPNTGEAVDPADIFFNHIQCPFRYQGLPGAVLSGGRAIPASSWTHFKTVLTEQGTVDDEMRQSNFNAKDCHIDHKDRDQHSLVEEDPNAGFEAAGQAAIAQPRHTVKRHTSASSIKVLQVT